MTRFIEGVAVGAVAFAGAMWLISGRLVRQILEECDEQA
jgi:hypothetical protein